MIPIDININMPSYIKTSIHRYIYMHTYTHSGLWYYNLNIIDGQFKITTELQIIITNSSISSYVVTGLTKYFPLITLEL